LIEKRKPEIVSCPNQDKRFNIKVDLDTMIPVIFFPMFKFNEEDLLFKNYGVI